MMTDRIKGFWVALDHDIREDDIQYLKNAILQFRSVLAVECKISSFDDYVAYHRIKDEIFKEIIDIFKRNG
jgi:hypothetical protein